MAIRGTPCAVAVPGRGGIMLRGSSFPVVQRDANGRHCERIEVPKGPAAGLYREGVPASQADAGMHQDRAP